MDYSKTNNTFFKEILRAENCTKVKYVLCKHKQN